MSGDFGIDPRIRGETVSGGIWGDTRGREDVWVGWRLVKSLSQEQLVAIVAAVLFVSFSLLLRNFFSVNNLLGLARSVAVLGILALGMAPVVISRGIDLSQVANFAISAGWAIHLMNAGHSTAVALSGGLLIAIAVGLFNGVVIAFVEIPALFVTLASGFLVFGIGQAFLLPSTFVTVPAAYSGFLVVGQSRVFGIPTPILIFLCMAVVVYMMLSRTSLGRFIYAHGNDTETSAITGIAVRPLTIAEYVISAVIAYIAALVAATTVASVDAQIFKSTLIFDVLLVVVLGGVSLAGGRGSAISVLVGTLLIGLLLNGMTIMNASSNAQDIIKGLVLFTALLIDNRLHPRDEETAREGDL